MASTHFFNPYNFVSTPPRNTSDDVLGDFAPRGHSRLEEGTISGSIVVRMTAETPLIIPSSDVAAKDGHNTKKTRVGGNHEALIPPSSVKGMIRSSFEMVTNSRYAVFSGHDERLGMREATTDALLAIPAVIDKKEDEPPILRLLFGNKKPRDLTVNSDGYLTWSGQGNWDKASLSARVGMKELGKLDLGRGPLGMVNFTFDPETMYAREVRTLEQEFDSTFLLGYVHATGVPGSTNGSSGLKKGNERIFFAAGPENQIDIPLTEELAKYWRDVIRDSSQVNERTEDKFRPLYVQEESIDDWAELNSFDTCYARVKRINNTYTVELVQPVHIGRELHPVAPSEVLHSSLQPAGEFSGFSPAERLFGWAHDGKSTVIPNQAAYGGHVRFGVVECLSDNAVEKLDGGRVLAILNSPKPSMARFYAGVRDQVSEVYFKKGIPKKAALYKNGTTLRGRKVYPHHGDFDRTSSGWQSESKSKTNQTILDWVRPDSKFEFTIHVRNISRMELGALLTSIETNEGECHRLGGARPLGFGAVSLAVDYTRSELVSQESQVASWQTCEASESLQQAEMETVKAEFVALVSEKSFYRTFKAYIKGYANSEGILVTYPRTSPDSKSSEEILKWFQENERSDRGSIVNGYALPPIGNSTKNALPFLRRPERNGNQNRGHNGPRR